MTDQPRTADYSHLKAADIRAPTLVDTVADHLRSSILSGDFSPGERLFEAALAREFGISRGPIREALALLEGDGLVVNEPRKGKFVRALDARTVDEIYSLRTVLEPYAAELVIKNLGHKSQETLNEAVHAIRRAAETGDNLAVARCDLAFHATIFALTDHRPLLRVWEDIISGTLQMLVSITTPTHQFGDPIRNHEQIVSSIVSADAEMTRSILTDHIRDGWKRASSAVRQLAPPLPNSREGAQS